MATWTSTARQRGAPSLLGRDVEGHAAPFSAVRQLHLRQAPLLYAASAFACGILLRHFWRPPSLLAAALLALIVCGLFAATHAPRLTVPAVAVVWVVLGWACAEMRPQLLPSAAVLGYSDGLRRDLIGTVADVEPLKQTRAKADEDPLQRGEGRADEDESETAPNQSGESIDLQLSRIEEVTPNVSAMVLVDGGVRLTLRGATPALHCGEQVRLTARLRPPPQFRDPGVWRYPEYLAADGISAVGSAKPSELHLLPGDGAATLGCRLAATRHWAANRLDGFARWQRHLPIPATLRWEAADAGLVSAMLFGDRSHLQHGLRVQFERTGSFHLFVVAGMHVGFVAGGVYALLVWLRVRRSPALVLAFAVTCGYALLTGFGAPVQRSLWMTAAYMLAQLLSRERSVLNALGLAALVLLVARPQTLFDSAFQMTVLVILAIGGLAMPLLDRTLQPYLRGLSQMDVLRIDQQAPPHVAQFRVAVRLAGQLTGDACGQPLRHLPRILMWIVLAATELSVLSLVVEMVMAVPMAIYFHRVTPLALPANLLVVPLVPLLLACSIATFIACLLTNWLALLPALAAAGLLRWTNAVIGGFGHLRAADWRIGDPPHLAVAAALALLCASLVAIRRPDRLVAWMGAAFAPLIMLLAVFPYRPRLHNNSLELTAIDVGQGDSLLLAAPNRATMLIDAGGQAGSETATRAAAFDTGESVVSPYLWSRGMRRLDVIVLTHAHMDHIGGMLSVLRNFQPRELWISVDADSETLRTLVAEAARMGVTVRHLHAGDRAAWPGGVMEVLNPEPGRPANREPVNDDSIVMRTTFGRASVLLEGDTEHPGEDRMAAEAVLHPVTLLKVGHHGSLTSTSEGFLALVRPQVAVISGGRGNRFGHPRMPVLQRLQAQHVLTARTDTMGATQYLLHADGTVETHFPVADALE